MNITITRLVFIGVARSCDDTVDKKRVTSCISKHLFLERFSNQKNRPKNPEMLSRRLLMSRLQNFAAGAAKCVL